MYPLWIVYLLILLTVVINYVDTSSYFLTIQTDRDKHQLEYAVNSASDAAIEQLLDTTKSAASNAILVDPDYIWKVYKYTFLRSHDMYSEEMMKTIEATFPSVVLAVNDGYYMRLKVDTQVGVDITKEYRFSQKIPYARTTLVNTRVSDGPIAAGGQTLTVPAGSIVADTLDGKNIWVKDFQDGVPYSVVQASSGPLESKIGSAHDLVDINRMLLNAIEYGMFYNSSASATDEVDAAKLSVPDQVSDELLSPSVNFTGPTIFVFGDTFTLRGKTYTDFYSVSGSQIVIATNYYTYTRGGRKYYSRRPPSAIPGASEAIDVFTRASMAASKGYRPDPDFY